MPDHDVGDDGVTQRVHAVRDHSLQQLAQLEESWGDTGADLQAEQWSTLIGPDPSRYCALIG